MSDAAGKQHTAAIQAAWSIELLPESPVLVVPWHDDSGNVAYVDLRQCPEQITAIPEAMQHPALALLLQRLNADASPWATAKCDRWQMDEEDMDAASFDLELARDDGNAAAGIGSYVDFYSRDTALFCSLQQHRELLVLLTEVLQSPEELRQSAAVLCELTLRRCIVSGQEGFAITAFVYAVGQDLPVAEANWAAALQTLADVLLRDAMNLPAARGVS